MKTIYFSDTTAEILAVILADRETAERAVTAAKIPAAADSVEVLSETLTDAASDRFPSDRFRLLLSEWSALTLRAILADRKTDRFAFRTTRFPKSLIAHELDALRFALNEALAPVLVPALLADLCNIPAGFSHFHVSAETISDNPLSRSMVRFGPGRAACPFCGSCISGPWTELPVAVTALNLAKLRASDFVEVSFIPRPYCATRAGEVVCRDCETSPEKIFPLDVANGNR